MTAYYSDPSVLPLPQAHRFPMSKYRLLRERLPAEGYWPQTIATARTPSAGTRGDLDGGGYADDVRDIVTIHTNTIREAVQSASHRAREEGAGVRPEGSGG